MKYIEAKPGAGGASGEANTASNQGTDGVGVYDAKAGVDLQFRNVAPASSKITTALNGKDIDVDVAEAALTHDHDGATGGGTIDHGDLGGKTADDHHPQSHTVASHSDTTATGTELETLTDGSDASALHFHQPSFLCYKNAAAQDLDGTNVAVNWGSAMHATKGSAITWSAVNPSRVTIATTGWYAISCSVYGTSATVRANIELQIRKDGTTFVGPIGASGYIRAASQTTSSVHIATFSLYLASGSYVEAVANTAGAAGTWNTTLGTSTIFCQLLLAA